MFFFQCFAYTFQTLTGGGAKWLSEGGGGTTRAGGALIPQSHS